MAGPSVLPEMADDTDLGLLSLRIMAPVELLILLGAERRPRDEAQSRGLSQSEPARVRASLSDATGGRDSPVRKGAGEAAEAGNASGHAEI
jgi:hypothetical protein